MSQMTEKSTLIMKDFKTVMEEKDNFSMLKKD